MKELSTEEISVTAAGSPIKELSVEDKIKAIQNTRCYKDMVNDWFPPYREKEYYFVSYSHQDYKLVYENLHRLQNGKQKLNLWYDHDLTPGRDWEKEARRYIYDYDCKGVIFFLSENAVLSDSIHKEIEFVKASGKEYLSINLPCEMIKGYEGEYLSAEKTLTLLKEQYGNDPAYVDRFSDYDNKLDVLAKTFNDKVIFLHLHDKIDNQIEGILSLKRQPLLVTDKDGVVTAINDINAEEITKEDFIHEYKYGKPVFAQRIGDCAFANCSLLRKVELPKECWYLGSYSFYNCKSLRKINLPNLWWSSNSLSDGVFQGCTSLESITIPDFVESIGNGAFRYCTGLESIIIPDRVHSIGEWAFSGCKSLESITIPDRVKSIGRNTFRACTSLESIAIPDFVESIGEWAFYNCTSLKSVEFGSDLHLTSIGGRAFRECGSLKSISIPNAVRSIGVQAFENCYSLKSVEFGGDSQLTSIGDRAFRECRSLESVEFGGDSQLTSIEEYAFSRCTSIKCITIPDNVQSIGHGAFFYCRCLKYINYKGIKQQWKNICKCRGWDAGTLNYVVHCTDGDLKKGEF